MELRKGRDRQKNGYNIINGAALKQKLFFVVCCYAFDIIEVTFCVSFNHSGKGGQVVCGSAIGFVELLPLVVQ